jgi:hypothetical protein
VEEAPEPAPAEEDPEVGYAIEYADLLSAMYIQTDHTIDWDEYSAGRMEGRLLSLMRYLMTLTEALPEPVLDKFVHSDERIEMKYIIAALEKINE